jgi:hypothetical protein
VDHLLDGVGFGEAHGVLETTWLRSAVSKTRVLEM